MNAKEHLEKQVKLIKGISMLSLLLVVALGLFVVIQTNQSKKLITTEGIIIKDAADNDRILMGIPIPDSPDRVRTDSAKAGRERSGYGIMKMDEENYCVNLGLDTRRGTEGVVVALDDYEGRNGVIVPGKDKTIYLGHSDSAYWAADRKPNFNGFVVRNKDSVFVDIQ